MDMMGQFSMYGSSLQCMDMMGPVFKYGYDGSSLQCMGMMGPVFNVWV